MSQPGVGDLMGDDAEFFLHRKLFMEEDQLHIPVRRSMSCDTILPGTVIRGFEQGRGLDCTDTSGWYGEAGSGPAHFTTSARAL